MPSIKVLPDNLINKIAAGEVVDRPASVVKELVENSIDAGATDVSVEVEQAGKRLLRVADNGSGMSREDARTAFERHATSKIAVEQDLDMITTMGFRGEALSSIAAVAQVRLLTAEEGAAAGTEIVIEGGTVRSFSDAAAARGTVIEVGHLFFNTPARLKFLKSASTELSHIIAAISRQAVAHPGIRFRLNHNKKPVLDLPPARTTSERLFQLHGSDLAEHLMDLSGGRGSINISGLIGRPSYGRSDRSAQEFYVNRRFVRNASLSHALYEAYRDLLMRDRHPAAFIFIDMDPALVDVNVHPAKAEVRFRNQSQVHDLLRDTVRGALREAHGAERTEHAEGVREAVREYLEAPRSSLTRPMPRGEGGGVSDALPLEEHRTANGAVGDRLPEMLYPLAQVHDSFIVAQSNEGMALIDQHAAHERVLFEKLQDQQAVGNIPVQSLLIPVTVELGPAEKELLQEHLPELRTLGFEVEPFGGTTFAIKGVPALIGGGDHRQLLLDVLDEIKAHEKSIQLDRLRDEVLSVMACHPAIKVHRKLTIPEMERLIGDLFACRMPHSCPHGRPTVIRFSLDEIRRMFKRI